jgi:hypothetical protein
MSRRSAIAADAGSYDPTELSEPDHLRLTH